MTHLLQSLDARGTPRFDYTFSSVHGLAVAPDTGRAYVMAATVAGARLFELTSDGSSCRAFTLPNTLRSAPEHVHGESLYSRTGRYRLVTNQ